MRWPACRRPSRPCSAVGLEARVIAGAGTGTYEHEAASRVYTELQPGSYVFMDADYARNLREDGGSVRRLSSTRCSCMPR